MTAACWFVACCTLLASGAPAAQDSPTTTRPAGPRQFQPGVWIDWEQRAVEVATVVVLRSGPLEFLACWPGKEHESILLFEPPATAVYMALGLVGLEPGHPARWNDDTGRYDDPAGDRLDIRVLWQAEGAARKADAYDWLRAVEYGRTPLPRPWIFAGSLRTPDGGLSADRSGVGVALVDFPDSLIAYSRRFPSRYGALWADANTPAIPPEGTPVRLRIRAAVPLRPTITIDELGEASVDERHCTAADLVDILRHAHAQDPTTPLEIRTYAALQSDVATWQARLEAAGLPRDWIRITAANDPPPQR